ncbi:MAG: cation:proton antiporter [Candidatus Diapherotrites archaeon]|nr:cation:proton antiporter [Candidatus Diapherotrites archaeon]
MDFIINLIVLLIAAKVLGELCERINFPSLLGYIIAGVIAGPMVLNITAAEEIHIFAQLGIILLLFITGFTQGDIQQLLQNKKAIALVSFLGFILPYIGVMVVGLLAGFDFNTLLFFALVFSATDSGITLKSLASTGRMASRAGRVILGVTVADGVVGLIIFTAIMTYLSIGGIDVFPMVNVLVSVGIFLVFFVIMQRAVPWLVDRLDSLTVEEAHFSFAFIFMILLALVAEHFGLDGIVGAFLAGVILSRSQIGRTEFIQKLSSASYAIFIPLFFVWTGLLLNLEYLTLLSFVMVAVALIANAIGAYAAGRLCSMPDEDSILMAITLLPRGDINLVIATIGLTMVNIHGESIVPPELGQLIYSSAMLLILVAAVATPIMLRLLIKKKEAV